MTVPGDTLKQEMVADTAAVDELWPLLPTDFEYYSLPDGRVVIADMPVELADMVRAVGDTHTIVNRCAIIIRNRRTYLIHE